jgi:hypothetical protein
VSTLRDLAAPMLAPGTTVDLKSLARSPELKTFASAAKKIEKMIASLEAGGDPDEQLSKEAYAVSMAINKLDDRTNKAEIRGDDVLREQAWSVVKALRVRKQAAEDLGLEAKRGLRQRQVDALRDKERARIEGMSHGQRMVHDYQRELDLDLARRGVRR